MKKLTIVVPNGDNNLSSITGAYEIFTKANEYWMQGGREALFHIQLAGITDSVEFNGGLFTVKPHTHIDSLGHSHLIIIPSLNHNYEKAVAGNGELIT